MNHEALDTIQSLRTTHWEFNDRPVARADVEAIIAHSMRAANSDNLYDYSVVVVDDPELLAELSGGESNGQAATCLFYVLDHTRIMHCAKALGYTDFTPLNRLYNLFIALHDVSAAAQTAVIAAKAMGIDSLTTNFAHRQDPERIKRLLNLPQDYCFPVMQVVLGYSDKPHDEITGRIAPQHIIHYNQYRPESDIDVNSLIQEVDAIYPGYVSEAYPHALDWYFKAWLVDTHHPESAYVQLLTALRQSGLLRREDCRVLSQS